MKRMTMQAVQALWVLLPVALAAHDILDFGAIHGISETPTAVSNSLALQNALQAANESSTDRQVLIPKRHKFWMMPLIIDGLHDIELIVDGVVVASGDYLSWPSKYEEGGEVWDLWTFRDGRNLKFSGEGKVDGMGYDWWLRDFQHVSPHRPHLMRWQRISNATVQGIKWVNSPMYHLYFTDCEDLLIQDMTIFVDVFRQEELAREFDQWDHEIGKPLFPINTDGVDVAGKNILVRNMTITNFDDAVVVKTSEDYYSIATCSENVTAEYNTVYFSEGFAIGSVGPTVNFTCIRDVTFRHNTLTMPFKYVYIKTNPGDEGSGLIENIYYEDFKVHYPIWWGVYIGPQQQKEPNGTGAGCMAYPLTPCPTQPLVTIRNVTLKDFVVEGSIMTPGVIRCDPENPCTEFYFENVVMDAWYLDRGMGYITENVQGQAVNCVPDPGFVVQDETKKRPERRDFESFIKQMIYN